MDIPEANEKPHLDIEAEIQRKDNGLFTCTLRINNGIIVDVTIVEYGDITKYGEFIKTLGEKLALAYNHRQGNKGVPVRFINRQRGTGKWNS